MSEANPWLLSRAASRLWDVTDLNERRRRRRGFVVQIPAQRFSPAPVLQMVKQLLVIGAPQRGGKNRFIGNNTIEFLEPQNRRISNDECPSALH
jgi:hypothetical protein